ncbi:MAG TPA: thioredoxin fold domain-containing protein [Desulfuromonadales bacterium]|nr:thioredoxin fold domain-containing protein [Desulfuromonadales bacterium]
MKLKSCAAILLLGVTLCISQAVAAGIDTSKSITIGSGAKIVFEFTDPDCPFCRKASQYFDGRTDVTRHIFFYPLRNHPRAKEKARFILSMPDKAKAYHDVMSGRMDAAPPLATTPEGIKLQEEQLEIAKRYKVDSTPTFMINGRIIAGFDQKKIDEALGGNP